MLVFYMFFILKNLRYVGLIAPLLIYGFLQLQSANQRRIQGLMLELNQLRLKRGKIVQEIIKGIKTIKFSVWERYIYQKLSTIRKDE